VTEPIILKIDPDRHANRHARRQELLHGLEEPELSEPAGTVHRLDRFHLNITGFVSPGDARSLERRLRRLEGVEHVHVSYSRESALVTVLDNRINEVFLQHVIQSAGYESYVVGESPTTPEMIQDERYREHLDAASWTMLPAVVVVLSAFVTRHTQWIPSAEINLVNDVQLYLMVLILWKGRALFVDAARKVGWQTAAREVPIGLAASAAMCASVWQFFSSGEPMFDVASAIVAGYHATAFLESWLLRRAERHFRRLTRLRPQEATVRRASGDYRIRIQDLHAEDVVVVNPGEDIPVDGVILDVAGTMVDESPIMGAGTLVQRERQSRVYAGTRNLTAPMLVRPERIGHDTVLGHVLGVVESARQTRAPVQLHGDRLAAFVAPWTLLLAVATFVGWQTLGGATDIWSALAPALSVLVVTCPWALGWASAVPVSAGMTHAARDGVLLRDAEALESIRGLEVLIFERAGTLTEGKPLVAGVDLVGDVSLSQALEMMLAVESPSRHAVADAFLAYGRLHLGDRASMEVHHAQSFRQIPGQGVIAQVGGREVLVGQDTLLAQKGITVPPVDDPGADSVHLYLAVDGELWARALVSDPFREDSIPTVHRLNQDGVRTLLVTSASAQESAVFAQTLGIAPENVRCGIETDAHGEVARAMRAAGFQVGVVGNVDSDQPSLQAADVSFGLVAEGQMGESQCAVSLLRPGSCGVLSAFSIARQAFRIIRQNLIASVIVMLAGVPAAFGLLPVQAAVLGMLIAVAVVGLNGLRVRPILDEPVAEPRIQPES